MGQQSWTVAFVNSQQQLIALRRQQPFTQQQMADTVGVHVNQIKRCEAGATQASLSWSLSLSYSWISTQQFIDTGIEGGHI